MLKITKVKRNSIAKELGLEVGDEITAFDGYACEDELDYLYYCTQENFSMTVKDKRGGEKLAEICVYFLGCVISRGGKAAPDGVKKKAEKIEKFLLFAEKMARYCHTHRQNTRKYAEPLRKERRTERRG